MSQVCGLAPQGSAPWTPRVDRLYVIPLCLPLRDARTLAECTRRVPPMPSTRSGAACCADAVDQVWRGQSRILRAIKSAAGPAYWARSSRRPVPHIELDQVRCGQFCVLSSPFGGAGSAQSAIRSGMASPAC